MNKRFTIGGVPEHFNFPWHQAKAEGLFDEAGIEVNWQDYSSGTGAMASELRENKLDMALLLTEGAVADIIKGGNYKIAGLFVQSPLVWGVHVHESAPYQKMSELEDKTFAISRYGSGSHLMAFVNAQQQGWNPDKLQFEIVGNMEGAREAMANHKADAFMWEKFMTKPLVDRGEWRRIGECPTPWPCFVAVVRDEIVAEQPETVKKVLEIAWESGEKLKKRLDAASLIAAHYHLPEEDVAIWFSNVRWAKENTIQKNMLREVIDTLYQLKIIDKTVSPEMLCNQLCRLV